MDTINFLPPEIIIHILSYKNIDVYDVNNFLSTCEQWNSAIDFNCFWKKKFFQRWPFLKNVYKNHVVNMENIKFKEEIKASMECRRKLWSYLSQMSQKHYHRAVLSDVNIKDFEILLDSKKNSMNIYFLRDELKDMIGKHGRQRNELDLTQKYYARELYSYLKRYRQRLEWQKFQNSTVDQTLERAATFVAQCWQPNKYISYTYVKKLLDDISQKVLEVLRRKYPAHSIFSLSPENLSSLKYNNIDNIQWNTEESHQIMNCIEDILNVFKEKSYEYANPGEKIIVNAEFIDYALETNHGSSLTIAVIFTSVAKRLGISCKILLYSLLEKPCVTWRSKELAIANPTNNTCFLLGIRESIEQIRSHKNHPLQEWGIEEEEYHSNRWIVETDCAMIIARTTERLNFISRLTTRSDYHLRASLEFSYLVETNLFNIRKLGEYYYRKDIDLSDVIIKLEKMQETYYSNAAKKEIKELLDEYRTRYETMAKAETYFRRMMPRSRTKPLKFLVGEIVKFIQPPVGYSILRPGKGVITGWDTNYDRSIALGKNDLYEERQTLIGFRGDINLSEPFYTIITKDKIFYVAEVLIEDIVKANEISHFYHRPYENRFSKFFCCVKETHFVPNETLAYYYPDDFQMLKEKYNF